MMSAQQIRSEISRLEGMEKDAARDGKTAVMENSERKRLVKERRELKSAGKDISVITKRIDELEAELGKAASEARGAARAKVGTLKAMLTLIEAPADLNLANLDSAILSAASKVEQARAELRELVQQRDAFLAAAAVRDLPPMQRAVIELQSIASSEKFGKLAAKK